MQQANGKRSLSYFSKLSFAFVACLVFLICFASTFFKYTVCFCIFCSLKHLGSLEASRGPLGASWGPLGTSWRPLGATWAPLGRSWGALGASWANLGGLLVPLGAVLGGLGEVSGGSWRPLGGTLHDTKKINKKTIQKMTDLGSQKGPQREPKSDLKRTKIEDKNRCEKKHLFKTVLEPSWDDLRPFWDRSWGQNY